MHLLTAVGLIALAAALFLVIGYALGHRDGLALGRLHGAIEARRNPNI